MLDFLGIGAQKCGTTWLYEHLQKHPEIRFPIGKEVHFWNKDFHKGVDWYNNFFPDVKGVLSGEITPAYAIMPPERIAEVHRHYPNLKLIYLVRNPIDRAWSGALMALGRAEMKLEEASDQWFLDHFNSQGSRARTDYATCLSNWQQFYKRKQILVLRYEDIPLYPKLVLKEVASHLGIKGKFFDMLPDEELTKKIYEGPGYPIRPSLLPVLEQMYSDSMWYKMAA